MWIFYHLPHIGMQKLTKAPLCALKQSMKTLRLHPSAQIQSEVAAVFWLFAYQSASGSLTCVFCHSLLMNVNESINDYVHDVQPFPVCIVMIWSIWRGWSLVKPAKSADSCHLKDFLVPYMSISTHYIKLHYPAFLFINTVIGLLWPYIYWSFPVIHFGLRCLKINEHKGEAFVWFLNDLLWSSESIFGGWPILV